MLYALFKYLYEQHHVPGAHVFQYVTFRAAATIITSLLVSMFYGRKVIRELQRQQVGEIIRDLGLEGQLKKQGTPTMGGIIIIMAIVIPTLLFARLSSVYTILMLVTTLWLGLVGFADDYIKVFKKDTEGLAGKYKIVGQIMLGLLVAVVLYVNPHVTLSYKYYQQAEAHTVKSKGLRETQTKDLAGKEIVMYTVKAPVTTIPFVKNNEFDYSIFFRWIGDGCQKCAYVIYALIIIFIITAVSNGANVTDGLDGLAAGTSAIIAATLGIFAYISGNIVIADYLKLMYIPGTEELVVFSAALLGACVGFLWYNTFPAQVFMGDTGSLTLGGIIATLAIILRKELLIPLLCGIFLVENMSVIIQVTWFKYTKSKYGVGRRVFLMSPLHHHFQKLNIPEAKIVTRFWIVGIMLAIITIITLKLR